MEVFALFITKDKDFAFTMRKNVVEKVEGLKIESLNEKNRFLTRK